jgi:hypothetical protein
MKIKFEHEDELKLDSLLLIRMLLEPIQCNWALFKTALWLVLAYANKRNWADGTSIMGPED